VEYCELSQDNDDGDDCGNACDIDSTDDNMCLEPGDQGLTPPGECAEALVGATFGWEDTSVTRGDLVDVELDLNGDNRCNGVVFFVKVYDADNPLKTSVVDPLPLEVTNDYGKTDWIAENNNPGPDPDDAEWMVKATAGGDVITSNDILIVVAGGISGYCGDGILNTTLGEQCDDGNNDDGDGCSFNCLNETIYGSGYGDGCTSFCVRGTAVCSTDGIMYCGDYDGDGCNEFSNPVSCSPYICDSNFGGCVDDAICTVEIDNALSCGGNPSFVCGKWGDCINGKVIRECKACSGNGCPVSPVKEMNCSIEPPVKGSFFGGIGFLIAVGLLLIYYVRRN
jgi:cysteine-rich repeat protein